MHYFDWAQSTLTINSGESLYTYIYLDPANPPTEAMVEFNNGTTAAAFHTAGELRSRDVDVAVDKPCIILKRRDRFWISDPTQRGCDLNIRSGKRSRTVQLPGDGAFLELVFTE